jgi:hypothetical protein
VRMTGRLHRLLRSRFAFLPSPQEPYELPQCRLAVLDGVAGQLVGVSPLELFRWGGGAG